MYSYAEEFYLEVFDTSLLCISFDVNCYFIFLLDSNSKVEKSYVSCYPWKLTKKDLYVVGRLDELMEEHR